MNFEYPKLGLSGAFATFVAPKVEYYRYLFSAEKNKELIIIL